jgi:Cof subfamily protein (haloacid dehalogenase superfamily)
MNQTNKIKLVATDLDGTFLKNDKTISQKNLEMLNVLRQRNIYRVVATGRNLVKTMDVIGSEIPFDFIVFSSGAGIYDWQEKKLLFQKNMSKDIVQGIADFLVSRDLNFHLFKPVPDNNQCWYHRGSEFCSEFESYFNAFLPHSEPIAKDMEIGSEACQFLVVFPNNPEIFLALKHEIESQFPDVKVVRTSSPLGTGYIWMEIFHHSVSKGTGVKFLCDLLDIDHEHTLGIGNDYNDIDLLAYTKYSYLVSNGPDELKSHYLRASSNEESAFALAVEKHL